MKKILVLFTGGTIGSATNDGIIDVEREGKYAVVEAYKSAYGDDVVHNVSCSNKAGKALKEAVDK